MASEREHRRRVDVRLPAVATRRELRELGAFVRFCIGRIEREVGMVATWIVDISLLRTGVFVSTITATQHGDQITAEGTGPDGTVACWNALGTIAPSLRAHAARGRIAAAI